MKTEEKIKTGTNQNNTNSTNDTNNNNNNDPLKRPNEQPGKEQQQPWKNPDPTTPEKEHIKEPYADEKMRTSDETEDTTDTNVDSPTGENKKENNPSYKPTYPEPDEKTATGNDVERESQQKEYNNSNLDKNRV